MSVKTISLNIMMSYPVKWTKQQVLRDIIQNFYDDAGADGFFKKLKINYKADIEKVTLSINSNGFNYEWLLHMGASTKQGNPGKFAGFYGEGFKIASLCAIRDYNWKIKMCSRDWSIDVCNISTVIDNNPVQQLAYNVTEGCPFSPITALSIESFAAADVELLNEIILGFYYPENPLFGKLIYQNEYISIYERSKQIKPLSLPSSFDLTGDGIVYIGYQARGSFSQPLVICNHKFKINGRDRHNIYSGTIIDIIIDTIDYINAKTAFYLLEKLEKYWYDYPDNKKDVDSWYSVIRKLIRKIVYFDSNLKEEFIKKYPNLVVCEQSTTIHMRNKKKQALTWGKHNLQNSHLVQDSFSLLGYETIVNLCEKAGGFNILKIPDYNEQKLIKILEEAAKDIFSDFFALYPNCLIIENDTSVYSGVANLLPNKKITYNNYGYAFRYTLTYIAIKKSSLTKENFAKAFSTYCHELSHCFGGDASAVFSKVLTDIISLLIKETECIQKYYHQWADCFNTTGYT